MNWFLDIMAVFQGNHLSFWLLEAGKTGQYNLPQVSLSKFLAVEVRREAGFAVKNLYGMGAFIGAMYLKRLLSS